MEVGKTYYLDNRPNDGVVLVKIYGKIFCRIKDPKSSVEWDVMLNRLSEVYIKNKKAPI